MSDQCDEINDYGFCKEKSPQTTTNSGSLKKAPRVAYQSNKNIMKKVFNNPKQSYGNFLKSFTAQISEQKLEMVLVSERKRVMPANPVTEPQILNVSLEVPPPKESKTDSFLP